MKVVLEGSSNKGYNTPTRMADERPISRTEKYALVELWMKGRQEGNDFMNIEFILTLMQSVSSMSEGKTFKKVEESLPVPMQGKLIPFLSYYFREPTITLETEITEDHTEQMIEVLSYFVEEREEWEEEEKEEVRVEEGVPPV